MTEHDGGGLPDPRGPEPTPAPAPAPARPPATPRSGHIDADGTWSDPGSDDRANPADPGRDIAYRDELEAKKKAAQHVRDMQRTIIYGIGGLISGVFLATLIVLAAGGIQEPFAQTIIQTIVSPLVASGGVVVGYFFGERKG